MQIQKYMMGAIFGMASIATFADVPVTFQAGTPAQASQVNQNFENLDARLNASFGTLIVSEVNAASSISSGVTSATCPSDRIVASANCYCTSVGSTRNFGVLFSCEVAGNGGVVGCIPDGVTFDPFLPPPRAHLKLMCLSGRANDGTPLEPVPVILSAGSIGTESVPESSTQSVPQSSVDAADELSLRLKLVEDQVLDHSTALRERHRTLE